MSRVHAAGVLLSLASIAYLMVALWRMSRFHERRLFTSPFQPPVTIMLPVCGAPRGLYECLRSCCEQDYPVYQVVFGLHRADDAGRGVIERIMSELPHLDAALVVDDARIGSNPKVSNLANMYRAVRHDVIVMVDSDVKVDPAFLTTVVAPLSEDGVGGVTCLYKGEPVENLASRLGAMHINNWLLPSMLVDSGLREIDLLYGAVMAVTRRSLESAGGFRALASAVAEDDVLGRLLRGAGFRLRLAPYVVGTIVAEDGVETLFEHELRWMRSLRACRPLAHACALVMHGLLPCSVLLLWPHFRLSYLVLLLLHAALKQQLDIVVSGRLGCRRHASLGMLLVRECLTFNVWLASFASRSMRWGGHVLRAEKGLQMAVHPLADGTAPAGIPTFNPATASAAATSACSPGDATSTSPAPPAPARARA